jgi:hypothetical protein
MNTHVAIASILLSTLSVGLVGQDLNLKVQANQKHMIAGVDGAPRGTVVILMLGLEETPSKLPNGQLLGISQDLLAGCAVADGWNPCFLSMAFGQRLDPGFTFYAQAVAIDLALPLDRQYIPVSQVRTVEIAKPQ